MLLGMLGVVSTPALFLMKPPDNIIQLVQGAVSLDDLSGRILLAAKDNGCNAMCPDCGNVMSDLLKKVQQLNQMFFNSCQLAQGLVNDAASVLPDKV